MRVRILNFRAVEEATLELGKTVLFGPNGGGKSSIMRAIALLLQGGEVARDDVGWGTDEALVESDRGWRLVIPGRLRRRPRPPGEPALTEVAPGRFSPPWIPQAPAVLWAGEYLTVDDGAAHATRRLEEALSGELLERIEQAAPSILGPAFGGLAAVRDGLAVKWEGRWTPFRSLSAGFRRALELAASAESAALAKEALGKDVLLLIEDFESSLYYDLALNLLEHLAKSPVMVIAELRTRFALRGALRAGWRAYYVEGRTKEVRQEEDLPKLEYE